MPTFAWIATYGSRQTTKPRVEVVKFGDGYESRTPIGLNSLPRSWDLTFENRPNSTADAIEDFLKDRGAVEAFNWVPPYGAAGRWVCREWSSTPTSQNTRSVTCTFEEVFEA